MTRDGAARQPSHVTRHGRRSVPWTASRTFGIFPPAWRPQPSRGVDQPRIPTSRMHRSLLSFLARAGVLALLVTRPLPAQDAERDTLPTVSPQVETLVSGGQWVRGAARGRYRVLVLTEGWETIRRRAFVQWLAEPEDPEMPEQVRATLELGPLTDLYALTAPVLARRGTQWTVTLRGAAQPMGAYDQPVRFVLGAPGVARRAPVR